VRPVFLEYLLDVSKKLVVSAASKILVTSWQPKVKIVLLKIYLINDNMKESPTEQKFRNTFKSLGTGLALVSPKGKWLDVNPALCSLLGYTKSELTTLTFQDITHPDDLHADLENLKRLVNNEIDLYSTEKRYIHKHGKIIWIYLITSVVKDINKKPLFFITQVQDITERRNDEKPVK
jgi:PAS domain S-box-containing protein